MGNFRRVHVFARYDEHANVTKTYIAINDPTTNDSLSAEVVGDYRNESEAVCVQAVLDDFYKRNYADKAMAESVQKVDEMDKLLARTRQEMAELKEEALTEMRAETERNREMLRVAFMTINSLLVGDEDDDEEEFDDVEDSEEGLG